MKKMMRTVMMATMAFALLLLPACGGGGSDDGAQAPAVEENGGESTAGTVGKAVDGKLTLKMADAAIMIKGTNVALPYDFDDIVAAAGTIYNEESLRDIELYADEFYSAYAFLDEAEDYVVIPNYYNGGEDALPIAEAEADGIGMATYAEEPVDQNVSILGVKFGMTKAEVTDLLGAPSWEDGDYLEWDVVMEDSDYEGSFIIYFTSDADDAVVSQADLDITDYGF